MKDEMLLKIIEAVKNMTDAEAEILEQYISELRAGKAEGEQGAGEGSEAPERKDRA